jgi:hypothetical protein
MMHRTAPRYLHKSTECSTGESINSAVQQGHLTTVGCSMSHTVVRRPRRVHSDRPIRLALKFSGEELILDSRLIDVSPSGVKVISEVPLTPGEAVQLLIPRVGYKQAVPCRVVWVGTPDSNRAGQAGLKFLVE